MKQKINLALHFFPVLFFVITSFSVYSQEFKITGKIFDAKTNHPLEFANVKVADTTYGTAADSKGNFILKLKAGSWKLITSYLGYFSDSIDVIVEDSDIERNIYLHPSEIFTETIEVYGEDPAVEIVRKAISYKKKFMENLNEYNFEAYTKYLIRSTRGGVNEKEATPDSGSYPILSLMETETQGYWRKPDDYKMIVKSRREAENSMVSGLALPYIVNFYDETIDFGFDRVKGPLADDALDFYGYKLLGTTSIDSLVVYKIEVSSPGLFPAFNGKIYIADSTFALMKVDLSTNDAVNITGVDNLNFKQKFTSYSDKKNKFWMPTDVQIYAKGSFAGLVKFSFDIYTVVSNYHLNQHTKGIFDDYIVKVLPDAKKDSSYWAKNQLIKNSDEENKALGSFSKESKEKKNQIRFGYPLLRVGDNFSFIGELPYHYNRVEGNNLNLNAAYNNRSIHLNTSGFFGYGFADKKSKYELNYSQSFLKDRSLNISASVFKILKPLSYELNDFYRLFNTATALFDKQDYYDYYYATGFGLSIFKSVIPQLGVTLKYHEEKQTSAQNNTSYSVRKHDELFRYNPAVNDGFQRTIGLSFNINPNKFRFADLGDDGILSFPITDYPEFYFNYDLSAKKLGSTYENRKYSFGFYGENNFNSLMNIQYKFGGEILSGDVPYQYLSYFNSTSALWDKDFSFKTMGYREYLGDKIFFLNFENNFRNILWSKISFMKKLELVGFFNAAKSDITNSNLALASYKNFSVLDKIFCEAGFGIKGILELIRVDFAWRLTNRIKGRNFNFSLSFGL
ncbi:MAG: DUF5686 family protein [Ignavibacteria bacterium]